MYLKRIALLLMLAAFGSRSCDAQESCSTTGGRIICSISERDPHGVGPLHVANESKVVIRVTEKSPFDDCTLSEVKLTEIKESDPIVTILQLLTKAATGASVPSTTSALSTEIQNKKTPATPAEQLLLDLVGFQLTLERKLTEATTVIEDPTDGLTVRAQQVDALFSNPPRTTDEYHARVPPLEATLQTILSIPDPSLETEQIHYGLLHDRLKQIITNGPVQGSNDSITISHAGSVLDVIAGQLAALKSNYDAVAA